MKKQNYTIYCLLQFLTLLSANNHVACENSHKKTIVLFSHGIADTKKQAFWYSKFYKTNNVKCYNTLYCFSSSFVTFNYPDATEGLLRVNYHETSFGQKNEIDRLYNAYQKTVAYASQGERDCNVILFGLSRGGSNVGILSGLYDLKHVKALCMESPLASMEDVIKNTMQKLNLDFMPLSYGQSVAEFIFKKYKRDGMNLLKVIKNISHEIPIFIVCSKEDQLVPFTSSLQLYKELVLSGHPNAYILILDHGKHSKILSGPDGLKYHTTLQAFYQKYNLPHDPSAAEEGKKFLALCQPNV